MFLNPAATPKNMKITVSQGFVENSLSRYTPITSPTIIEAASVMPMEVRNKSPLKVSFPLSAIFCFFKWARKQKNLYHNFIRESIAERVFQHYRLFPLGAHRYDDYPDPGHFLYPFYVELRILREILKILYAPRRFTPPFHRFVDGLAFFKDMRLCRKIADAGAFIFIAGAYLYFGEAVQDVEFCKDQSVKPVSAR